MRASGRAAVRLRRLGWAGAALVGLVLIVVVGAPLLVRGRALAHLVDHLSQDLCGSVTLEGGRVSLSSVPALIFQRPFDVELDKVRILEPEGRVFFRARAVRVRMTVVRRPWDVAVDEVTLSDGAWALVNKRPGEPITVAFRKVPPAGRSECRTPTPPPARPPRQGEVLDARRVILRNVSVVLSFPDWAALLDSVDARGSLKVRVAGDELQFLFDVRDVSAKRGGSLRIGPAGRPLTPEVPFDDVAIRRIAVTEAAPHDLMLDVRRARTGDATLSGRALFTDVFVPTPRRLPAGMKLDAEWRGIGQALVRDPTWAPLGERLDRLDAALRASLRGPFLALTGSAALVGHGASVRARLLPQRRYELSVQLHDLDTAPLLAPAWREQIGGHLDGRVFVKAQLGREPRAASISVETLELDLRRTGRGAGPRRVIVSRSLRPSSSAELQVEIGSLTLENQVLRAEPLHLRAPGIDLGVNASAQREASSGAFLFEVASTSDSRVVVRGETFRLPPLLRARLGATHEIAIEPFSVPHLGGGAIDVGGSVRSGGRTDLRVAVRDYPLARIPGLAGVHAPGQGTSIGQALRGQLNASFELAGPTKRPCLSGQLGLTGVSWAAQPFGDGRVIFRCVPDGTRYEGRLIGALKIRGELRRHPGHGRGRAADTSTVGDLAISGPGIVVDAALRLSPQRHAAKIRVRVDLAEVQTPLSEVHLLRRAAGVVAADVRWRAAAPQWTPEVNGTIEVAERLSVWPTRLPAAIGILPTRIELRGDEIRVPRLTALTSGARATFVGEAHHLDWSRPGTTGTLDGTLSVLVDGRALASSYLGGTGSGAARAVAKVSGSIASPHVKAEARFDALTVSWPSSPAGAVQIDGPIGIDGPRVLVGPLLARFGAGGWLEIGGPQGPGRLTLAPRAKPLPVKDVALNVRGGGLTTERPIAGLGVKDVAVGLRLTDVGARGLLLRGDVFLGHGLYDLGKRRKAPVGARPAHHAGALDRIWIDVNVRSPEDAVVVRVPHVPDLSFGLRCRVEGPLSSLRMTGEVKGNSLYSRLALRLADWFSDRDLGKCDIGPH